MAEGVRLDRGASNQVMDKSITLPPDEIFRNLENAKRFAIDIGRSRDTKTALPLLPLFLVLSLFSGTTLQRKPMTFESK